MDEHASGVAAGNGNGGSRWILSPEQLLRFESMYQAQRERGPRSGRVTIRCGNLSHSRAIRVAEFQRGCLRNAVSSGYGWAQVMSQSEYRERGWAAVRLDAEGARSTDQPDRFGWSFRLNLFDRGGQIWLVETPEHFLASSGGRLRYELRCVRCSGNVVARREKLCEALDLISGAGSSRVTLRELSAIIARIGRK